MGLTTAYNLWGHFTDGQTETRGVRNRQAGNLVAGTAVSRAPGPLTVIIKLHPQP